MRYLILIFGIWVFPIITNAQSSHIKLFEDGKSWLCETRKFSESSTQTSFEAVVSGDTIVNGCQATRLCLFDEAGCEVQTYAVSEEDGLVSVYSDIVNDFVPLMDFNKHTGDIIDGILEVKNEKSINVNGVERRMLSLGKPNMEEEICCWVEGIGANINIYITLFPSPIGHYTYIVKCFKDGQCIFTEDDFRNLTNNIARVENEKSEIMSVYDLNGRLIECPQKGKVYVMSSKKVVW